MVSFASQPSSQAFHLINFIIDNEYLHKTNSLPTLRLRKRHAGAIYRHADTPRASSVPGRGGFAELENIVYIQRLKWMPSRERTFRVAWHGRKKQCQNGAFI